MTDAPRINPAACGWALILAPLSLAVPCFALAMVTATFGLALGPLPFLFGVPPVATILGAPTYLTFGTVAYLRTLDRPAPSLARFAWNGFLAHLASTPVAALCLWLADPGDAPDRTLWFLALGAIFAPLWRVIFGALYRSFSRKIHQRPS